jgi:HlyD family secretion protein
MRKYILPIVFLLILGGGAGYWYLTTTAAPKVTFRTEPVSRGELVATVSASGTLEPEEVIDVGAQVAGQIIEFGVGADGKPIDYGSPVEAGTVLARIDDALYRAKAEQSKAAVRSAEQQLAQSKAKLEQAHAGVEQAKANTLRADADLKQTRAKADQTDKDWARAQALKLTGSISQTEYDAAKSAYDANRAAVGVSEAALAQARAAELNARAAVTDAQAAVGTAEAAVATAKAIQQQDEVNLGYCTIRSTVKGKIIDRRVTIGQTVQSSFNTPSLFLIAKDLSRMTVWASVNEADVGQVRVGQPVRFTVDAYPGQKFDGTVSRIRLNATNTQNVVVYTVEVTTRNPDEKLLPYMTANLQFEVDRRSDALLVPNAALRYKPPPQLVASSGTGGGKPGGKGAAADKDRQGQGVVWVEEDGKVRAVPVQLGLTDGTMTEVVAGDLPPGTAVVVGEVRSNGAASADATNPFAPPRFGASKKK